MSLELGLQQSCLQEPSVPKCLKFLTNAPEIIVFLRNNQHLSDYYGLYFVILNSAVTYCLYDGIFVWPNLEVFLWPCRWRTASLRWSWRSPVLTCWIRTWGQSRTPCVCCCRTQGEKSGQRCYCSPSFLKLSEMNSDVGLIKRYLPSASWVAPSASRTRPTRRSASAFGWIITLRLCRIWSWGSTTLTTPALTWVTTTTWEEWRSPLAR